MRGRTSMEIRKRILRLRDSVPCGWADLLAPYGYEAVSDFLSTCGVDGGVAALAAILQCPEDEVREVAAALREQFANQLPDLAPVDRPLGALFDEDEEERDDE